MCGGRPTELVCAGHGSPAKQGIKRERSRSETRNLTPEAKPLLQSLPLDPGIEAAIRQNPGLVKGYAASKVAHEQRLHKLLPDLMDLMPLCNQIIRDSQLKQQQQQRHSIDKASPAVQSAKFALPSNKKAKLNDSLPHRLSNPANAGCAAQQTNGAPVHKSLLRMNSRTGSSGGPVTYMTPFPSLPATSARRLTADDAMPSQTYPHPHHKQSDGDMKDPIPEETWQAAHDQPVPSMQAGLTAIKTKGDGAAVCRDGQKPQLSGDPSSKGNAGPGEGDGAGQSISPTAVSPPTVKSPKTSRYNAAPYIYCLKCVSYCELTGSSSLLAVTSLHFMLAQSSQLS